MRTCVRMTSEGHAASRPMRLLEGYRGSVHQIRALVAELPRPPDLELALAICLGLLDREPGTFPRAPARWVGRFTLERKVTLSEAQLTLAAASLSDGDRSAGAQALAALCQHYQLNRGEQVLSGWIEPSPPGRVAPPIASPGREPLRRWRWHRCRCTGLGGVRRSSRATSWRAWRRRSRRPGRVGWRPRWRPPARRRSSRERPMPWRGALATRLACRPGQPGGCGAPDRMLARQGVVRAVAPCG